MTGRRIGALSMTDKFLHHRSGRLSGNGFDTTPPADSAVDDFHSFGWLRGIRDRAAMLELRKRSGNVMAISYGWIERAEFDPSEGITLHFHGETIRIRGRNLNAEARPEVRLFQGITRQRVAWIQEIDRIGSLTNGVRAPVVETIDW
jgi:hypothetical protein